MLDGNKMINTYQTLFLRLFHTLSMFTCKEKFPKRCAIKQNKANFTIILYTRVLIDRGGCRMTPFYALVHTPYFDFCPLCADNTQRTCKGGRSYEDFRIFQEQGRLGRRGSVAGDRHVGCDLS